MTTTGRLTTKNKKRASGALMIVAAMTLIPISDGLAKNLMASLPLLQIVLLRYLAQFLWLAPFVIFRYHRRLLHEFDLRGQMIRGAMLLGSLLFFYASISAIPLARAVALVAVSPFIVALLSFAVLGERVRAANLVCIGGGFGGVLLIARPDIGLEWGNVLALASGIMYALFLLATRKLTGKAPAIVGSFFTAAVGVIVLLPLMLFIETESPSARELGVLAAIGALIAGAHYLLNRAFEMARAAFLSLFTYWEIPAAIIIGFALHNDIPEFRDWAGIAVIIFCGIALMLSEQRRDAA